MAERLYPMTMTAGSVSLLAAHPLGVEATLAWMEYTDTQALTDMLLECGLHGHVWKNDVNPRTLPGCRVCCCSACGCAWFKTTLGGWVIVRPDGLVLEASGWPEGYPDA